MHPDDAGGVGGDLEIGREGATLVSSDDSAEDAAGTPTASLGATIGAAMCPFCPCVPIDPNAQEVESEPERQRQGQMIIYPMTGLSMLGGMSYPGKPNTP